MTDKRRLELLEKMMQEYPKALSLVVPMFTLEVLIKNCWEKELLQKQIDVEKERADFYQKQLRLLEVSIIGKDFKRG
ncbi:hypothetical protein DHX103_14355 [Planococcus sp. X10-3]|uniref:hypothetical protein n=1 Tax=Planococcus sp. X10-3 TaxID=3061240 RepID=UPI003BB1CA8F